MKMKLLTIVGLLMPLMLKAGLMPDLVMPEGVGVNIHFNRGHEKDLDLIAAGGFKFIRMDLGWAGIERRKGEYDWTAYDELTANLEQRGLRAIYILDYSNPLYEEMVVSRNPVFGGEQKDTASPQRPGSVAAFAQWSAAAAVHFRGRPVIWEIWNEPNISFWKPKPDVAQYNTLALATCRAIREAVPEAVIVGPATSEFPWAFLDSFLASGILHYLDAVSVHPYRSYAKGPETAGEDYQKLRDLIAKNSPKPPPIISGEWGYAAHTKGVSAEIQAAFLVRQQLANLHFGIPISIWYDWKNDGDNPAEREDNFGTVMPDLRPKPAYQAIQTVTRQLAGFRIQKRLDLGSAKDWALVWVNLKGQRKLSAWTTSDPHPCKLEPAMAAVARKPATTLQGKEVAIETEGPAAVLNLTGSPLIIELE